MPAYYNDSLATAGNLTANGTANTETETAFFKPGANQSISIYQWSFNGRGSNLTALSSIEIRPIQWGTASTAGTGLSLKPTDPRLPAATATASSRPTSGTTRTNLGPILACGVTGANGFNARDYLDDALVLSAGNAGSLSFMDVATLASLLFSIGWKHLEV